MKKHFIIVILAVTLSMGANAQEKKGSFTFNTRAWSTNYWTHLLYNTANALVTHFVFDDDKTIEAVIPDASLVFPIGITKEGFAEPLDIHSPYHRAFSNPFNQLGDYGIGVDMSWTPTAVGLYAGAYYKSQEICFTASDQNLRGNYFQPRAGLILGGGKTALEAGAFYDMVLNCTGSWGKPDKDMILGGWGLDFALSSTNKSGTRKNMLMFSLPLHNFFNEAYAGGLLKGLKRKVGYIMVSHRVIF